MTEYRLRRSDVVFTEGASDEIQKRLVRGIAVGLCRHYRQWDPGRSGHPDWPVRTHLRATGWFLAGHLRCAGLRLSHSDPSLVYGRRGHDRDRHPRTNTGRKFGYSDFEQWSRRVGTYGI